MLDVRVDAGVLLGGDGASDEVCRLGEILIPVRAQTGQAAVLVNSTPRGGCGVEISQVSGQAFHQSFVSRPTLEKGWQHACFGQPPHQHCRLNRDAWPSDGQESVALDDIHHAEVEVRAQAPVEAHLRLAIRPPPLEGREVQEPEVDRFAELVHKRAGQDHPGDVGFNQTRIWRRMRERCRTQSSAIRPDRSDRVLVGAEMTGFMLLTPVEARSFQP